MSAELRPTPKQKALLQRIRQGDELLFYSLADGEIRYSINGSEKIHLTTAQSCIHNNWLRSERLSDSSRLPWTHHCILRESGRRFTTEAKGEAR